LFSSKSVALISSPFLDTCRKYGAIVATSHEHSYERTHLMASFENKTISSTKNELHIMPGHTFAFVSGLGGDSIRYWKEGNEKNPWWAAKAALDVSVLIIPLPFYSFVYSLRPLISIHFWKHFYFFPLRTVQTTVLFIALSMSATILQEPIANLKIWRRQNMTNLP
jgi:hypothetical protein